MNRYELIQAWLIGFCVIAIFLYFIIIVFAIGFNIEALNAARETLLSKPAFFIGIPATAVSSFALVSIFWKLYPTSEQNSNEKFQLSAFGLKFSGPGGPITLWILCFLSLVFSMHLLS